MKTTYKALASRLLSALRLIEPADNWHGWENGNGADIGKRIGRTVRVARKRLKGTL